MRIGSNENKMNSENDFKSVVIEIKKEKNNWNDKINNKSLFNI